MDLVERLQRDHGCLRTGRLVRDRQDERELRRLVETGVVVRHGRGLYALRGTPAAVVAARRTGGAVTCVSLLHGLGLPVLHVPGSPHVSVPGGRGAPRAGVLARSTVLHWDEEATGDTVLADVPTALCHALRCVQLRDVVALADAALHRRLLRDVGELAARRPLGGRATFDRLLRLADGRSESMPETFLRLALVEVGLQVEPQVAVEGVGRVDLLVEGLLVVEVDGYAYHHDRRAFAEDRRRDRVAELRGIPVLRFTFDDAVHDTARAVHEVLAALVRHRSGASAAAH
ncbi:MULTISPECIES: endonuclease domain-containing protein [unclassified Actinotalea]|uniref:endonuclease domain-containing protein n=1 Tax=unclassified Actinotalea TaxID=2638618 RepID=UPI0015F57FE2|nr:MULTISPECIES: DUF559 domain-containing protein [unclassified Actinotalea]